MTLNFTDCPFTTAWANGWTQPLEAVKEIRKNKIHIYPV